MTYKLTGTIAKTPAIFQSSMDTMQTGIALILESCFSEDEATKYNTFGKAFNYPIVIR